MNAKTLIAAAAIALVGTTAFADEVRDYPTPSTLTRAEVIADMQRGQAGGDSLNQSETYGTVNPLLSSPSATRTARTPSRDDVTRTLASAPNAATIIGETYGTVQPGASIRSRESVRAEAVAAQNRPQNLTITFGD